MNHGGKPCSISGCNKKTAGYSTLCETHRSVRNRWGHALQRPMTKGELQRLSKHVTALINTRHNPADLWVKLREALRVIRREAQGVLFEVKPGKPVWGKLVNPQVVIYQTLVDAEPDAIIAAMIAIGYAAGVDRHRFRNDEAYFMTAGRRYYLLSRANFETHINPSTGKRHLTCREPRSGVIEEVGRRMMSAFGAFGLRLAMLENEAEQQEAATRQAPLLALSNP